MQLWTCELPPVLEAIQPAALKFREWIEQCVDEGAAAACELALVEACNNLVIHGHSREPIQIRAEANADEVFIGIRDKTTGFAWPEKVALPETESDHGRGIFLIHALMSEVKYERGGEFNELQLRKKI